MINNGAPSHQGLEYIPLQQGQGQASDTIPMATSDRYEAATGDKHEDASPALTPTVVMAQSPVVVQVRDHFANGTNSRTSRFSTLPQHQPQQQQQQQQTVADQDYKHAVDFVVTSSDNSPVDTRKNRKVSGYTFTQFRHNVHDWRKKEFWIFVLVALTIILTVLGVEVWAPMASSNGSGSGSGERSCGLQCTFDWSACREVCEATDVTLKTCVAGCPAGDHSCTSNCGFSNACYKTCSDKLHACSDACPKATP